LSEAAVAEAGKPEWHCPVNDITTQRSLTVNMPPLLDAFSPECQAPPGYTSFCFRSLSPRNRCFPQVN